MGAGVGIGGDHVDRKVGTQLDRRLAGTESPRDPGTGRVAADMKLLVLSDIHFACEAERARAGHEARVIGNPLLRLAAHAWRSGVWLRDPNAHNHRLDAIVARNPDPDLVIANGDFTVDSAFVGVSDPPSRESARLALGRLREAYSDRLLATIGDHDLGKMSLFGGAGGPRLDRLRQCVGSLGLETCWVRDVGVYRMLGVTSSLLALPVFERELLDSDRSGWHDAREAQFRAVRTALDSLEPGRRLILFVHDPTALPFLDREPSMRKLIASGAMAATVIGHLHTPMILTMARGLAGIPEVRGLGVTARRYTSALRQAACWKRFRLQLCPSPAGCQLLKDGGFLRAELDPSGSRPLRWDRVRLPWDLPGA